MKPGIKCEMFLGSTNWMAETFILLLYILLLFYYIYYLYIYFYFYWLNNKLIVHFRNLPSKSFICLQSLKIGWEEILYLSKMHNLNWSP